MHLKYFLNEFSELLGELTVAQTGRVWDIYVYDEHVGVNNCSLTPDYYCYNIGFFTEKPISDEMWGFLHATLRDCDWPCRMVDRVGKEIPTLPVRHDDEDDEEYLESALDWCRANCGMFEWIPGAA